MGGTKRSFLSRLQGIILRSQILSGKVKISELEEIEKTDILFYALETNNIKLQKSIFKGLNDEDKERFIKKLDEQKLFFNVSVMEDFYTDFVKVSFQSGCDNYLIELLKIGLNNPIFYTAQVNLIKGYFEGEGRNIIAELNPNALEDGSNFNQDVEFELEDETADIINKATDKNADILNDPVTNNADVVRKEGEIEEDSLPKTPKKDNIFKKVFRSIKRKIDLRWLLLNKKYHEIILWSHIDENLLSELSDKDIEKLFIYAKNFDNYKEFPCLLDDLHKLFEMVRPELQKSAIVYYNSFGLNYGGKEVMTAHFGLFLEVSIMLGYNNYIYKLANIAVSDKEKYAADIETIKSYVLAAPPSDDIVKIAGIECIKEINGEPKREEVTEKVPDTHKENEFTPDKTAEYYNNADTNLKEQVLVSYLKGKPNIKDYIDFIKKTNSFMEAYKALPTVEELSDSQKSEYLLEMFFINEDAEIKESLIEDILYLNDFNTIARLMPHLKEAEQNRISDEATTASNYRLMATLACTTKCSATFFLITNIVMLHKTNYAIFLVANLKGRYLEYVLKMISNVSSEWYVEIVRGLVDKPNHVKAVEYIFDNHMEHLFSPSDLNSLKNRLVELSTRESGFGQHYTSN